jgi:hypothetical protein
MGLKGTPLAMAFATDRASGSDFAAHNAGLAFQMIAAAVTIIQ